MELHVKVIPKASKSEFVGWENGELKIRLKAVPQKGEANDELILFLSKSLKIPKSHIELVAGVTSRHKKLNIPELSIEDLNKFILNSQK